jgi:hypothetical protein
VLIRDNLAKRKNLDDKSRLFCKEDESVQHVFFYCCVAKFMWQFVAEITNCPVISNFESFGKQGITFAFRGMLDKGGSATM